MNWYKMSRGYDDYRPSRQLELIPEMFANRPTTGGIKVFAVSRKVWPERLAEQIEEILKQEAEKEGMRLFHVNKQVAETQTIIRWYFEKVEEGEPNRGFSRT